jgi:phosphatidylglycerol:prolipoprotein diacylglycerol transferase
MNALFTFDTESSVYELTFLLAVIARAFLFFRACKTERYPLEYGGYIMLSAFTFFLIGSKVMTFSGEEWNILFSSGELPDAPGKTMIGGLLFGLFGFYLATSILKARSITPDVLAIALPVAMGIQRIGCFTTGCCHGEITQSWLGVQYDTCTVAGMHQIQNGLISANSAHTLAVFPTTLFLSLGCFVIAGIIAYFKKRGVLHRGYFLLSISLYLFLTFLVDFYRTGFNNPSFGIVYGGLKVIQWLELSVSLVFLIWYLSKRNQTLQKQIALSDPDLRSRILLILCCVVPSMTYWNWFSTAEQVALILTYIPILIFPLERLKFPVFKWYQVSAILSLTLLLVFRQSIVAQDPQPPIISNDKYPSQGEHSYSQIDGGYEFESHHQYDGAIQQSGCMGAYYSPTGNEYRHESHSLAVNYSKVKTKNRFDKSTLKLGGVTTYTRESIVDSSFSKNYVLGTIWGKYTYDSRWIGGGIGISAGYNMAQDTYSGSVPVRTGGASLKADLLWDLRIFPTRIIYLYANNGNDYFNNGLNHNQPLRPVQFGFGSGFGQLNGTRLQLGFAMNNEYRSSLVADFTYFYRNAMGISFRYQSDPEYGITFSTGLSYRFNQR